MNNISILVLSCDKYANLFKFFENYFLRNWPDCNFPKYFCTNKIKVYSKNFVNINYYPDLNWSTTLKGYLQNINTKYVLLLLDDALINNKLDNEYFKKLIKFLSNNNVNHLHLRNNFSLTGDNLFEELPKFMPYRCNVTGIWNKSHLLKILQNDENPWEFEINGSYRVRTISGYYYSKYDFFDYIHLLEKGKIISKSLKNLSLSDKSEIEKLFGKELLLDSLMRTIKNLCFNFIIKINFNKRIKFVNFLKKLFVSY